MICDADAQPAATQVTKVALELSVPGLSGLTWAQFSPSSMSRRSTTLTPVPASIRSSPSLLLQFVFVQGWLCCSDSFILSELTQLRRKEHSERVTSSTLSVNQRLRPRPLSLLPMKISLRGWASHNAWV